MSTLFGQVPRGIGVVFAQGRRSAGALIHAHSARCVCRAALPRRYYVVKGCWGRRLKNYLLKIGWLASKRGISLITAKKCPLWRKLLARGDFQLFVEDTRAAAPQMNR